MRNSKIGMCRPNYFHFISIAILLICSGCNVKRNSIGADHELVILAVEKDRMFFSSFFQKIFTDTMFTPQPEPIYKIKFSNPKQFTKLKMQSNIILGSIGDDIGNEGTKLIRKILGKQKFEETIIGNNHIIISENQFANQQLFMILSAPTQELLYSALMGKESWIKSLFEKKYNQRQSTFLFDEVRQETLEDRLMNTYFWNIKIPWGWDIVKEIPDSSFLWLGKELPFRWISFQWQSNESKLDSNSLEKIIINYPIRNYGTIQFNPYKFKIKKGNEDTWFDWKASGIWESLEEPMGGPFNIFIKLDKSNDRLFLINSLIHYPGEEKSHYMKQMELISSSIQFS